MSEIVKHANSGRELSHIVKTDTGVYYYVDSNDTPDAGYETMAFLYDEEKDEVAYWSESYAAWYKTYEQMEEGHFYACNHLEEMLKDWQEAQREC